MILRRISLLVLLCLALWQAAGPAAAAEAARFRRGTNLTWFAFPATTVIDGRTVYADPPYAGPDAHEPTDLTRLGFDHVRLLIDFGPIIEADAPHRRRLFEEIDQAIARLRRSGLGVIVTLLAPGLGGELPMAWLDGTDGPRFERFKALVEEVAGKLERLPAGTPVALELLNEPQQDCRAEKGTDWSVHQKALVEDLRGRGIGLPLLLTGGCWSTIEGIVMLDGAEFADRRNLISVHFYDPFVFTHQGSDWALPFLAEVTGLPYPAGRGSVAETLAETRAKFAASDRWPPAERDAKQKEAEDAIRWYFTSAPGAAMIAERFATLARWQQDNRIDPAQFVFTEFGAMRQPDADGDDEASRARWLRDVSSAIEKNGWGWSLWVLHGLPFGLYPTDQAACPETDLIEALRLTPPATCR
jgi:hypothetical protein